MSSVGYVDSVGMLRDVDNDKEASCRSLSIIRDGSTAFITAANSSAGYIFWGLGIYRNAPQFLFFHISKVVATSVGFLPAASMGEVILRCSEYRGKNRVFLILKRQWRRG
jgi:hypothetical protein